jgi:hypothetical protein
MQVTGWTNSMLRALHWVPSFERGEVPASFRGNYFHGKKKSALQYMISTHD